MKIDVVFALPGPQNAIQGDKLLVVAAATEHEDPGYLTGVIADVADAALEIGAYRSVRKVTLEIDDVLLLAMLQDYGSRAVDRTPRARMHPAALN
jgi:hypothetical protein